MKRIVLCCDGTWQRADQQRDGQPSPTNVVRMSYLTAKHDAKGVAQILSYDQGVGTGNVLDAFTGGAFGDGLDLNIFEAYRFLIANYEPGDELFLFGFSRGAYTVRSIAGMIRKCGILRREVVEQYRAALQLYRDPRTKPDDEEPTLFRKTNSVAEDQEIPITFMGVFDTVGALGIPLRGLRWVTRRNHQFHDTELSGSVKNAYQALAIDEKRDPFLPTLWTFVPKEGQTVEQVWFSGVHSDVGGGFKERELSDLPLQWMLDKAAGAGLAIDVDAFKAHKPKGVPTGKLHGQNGPLYQIPGIGKERTIGLVVRKEGARDATPQPDPTQSVHPSALARWDADKGYRPPPLRAYLKRIGDPRASD